MDRSRKYKQRGGVGLPMEYFNPNSKVTHYYPSGDHHLKLGNNAYGPQVAVSYGATTTGSSGYTGPNMAPYPNSTATHTGGGALYDRIVNPETGRKVSLFTSKGKRVLKNYLQASQ